MAVRTIPPTEWRRILPKGILRGTSQGNVWLWRRLPSAVLGDAMTTDHLVARLKPLEEALEELAGLSVTRMGRRDISLNGMREVHVLSLRIPSAFRATGPLGPLQEVWYRDETTFEKAVFVGVRLLDDSRRGSKDGLTLAERAEDAADNFLAFMDDEITMDEFAADERVVSDALARANLSVPTAAEIELLCAWFNPSRQADVPVVEHLDHLHVFAEPDDLRLAVRDGLADCNAWTDNGAHAITFAAVQKFEFARRFVTDPTAHWVERLHERGALAISVRGLLEPAAVTRNVLRAKKKSVIGELNEAAAANKLERGERERQLDLLSEAEDELSSPASPATLTATSVTVAFNGRPASRSNDGVDLASLSNDPSLGGMKFAHLTARQLLAFRDAQPTSTARANPHLQDLPTTFVAAAGFGALAKVGDDQGALIGFSVGDRQPCFLIGDGAARESAAPFMAVIGGTGAGKTVVALNVARQWSAEELAPGSIVPSTRRPFPPGAKRRQIFINPKLEDDLTDAAHAAGGDVVTLSDLSLDGLLDPFRYSANPVEIARPWLLEITSAFGQSIPAENIMIGLAAGQKAGARCMSEALDVAVQVGRLSAADVARLKDLAASVPLVRMVLGSSPEGDSIQTATGLTVIQMGSVQLSLQSDGLDGVISRAAIRALVFAAMSAVEGGGTIWLDEAWVFLEAGREVLDMLGRTARSMHIGVALLTQKAADAYKAGVKGFISRGLVLPIANDAEEAASALALLGVEPTQTRVQALAARKGRTASSSMHANVDERGNQVGTRAFMVDLTGEMSEVELVIPAPFLAACRTDPEGREARARAREITGLRSTPAPAAAPVPTRSPASWAPPTDPSVSVVAPDDADDWDWD